jgi:hypothetical protein
MITVYDTPARICYRTNALFLHAEKNQKSAAVFMELRETGTGGPMSGILHATFKDGEWDSSVPDEAILMVETALRHLTGQSLS